MGLLDSFDEYPGPQLPVGPNDYMVNPPPKSTAVLTQGRDTVLPSHEFWDRYVSTSPAVHDQIGKLQSAGISALDALGFGFPMALAHRLAPDTAQRIDAVRNAYPNEKFGGDVAGMVANPANGVLRGAGNALAARGFNLGTQAAADAAVVGSLYAAPKVVEDGSLRTSADIPATTAGVMRLLNPKLPDTLVERVLRGAQAGAIGQAPAAIMQDDFSRPLAGATYGAVHGASLKPKTNDIGGDRDAIRALRSDYFERLGNGAMTFDLLRALGFASDYAKGNGAPESSPPIDDPRYPHLKGLFSD